MPLRRPEGRRALRELASPIRLDVLSALGEGEGSVREVAQRTGRSRQALHYHVERLRAAGVLRLVGTRGSGRGRERVYAVRRTVVDALNRHATPSPREALRAARATFSLGLREVHRALQAEGATGPCRPLVLRGRRRLTEHTARRVTELVLELGALIRSEPVGVAEAQPYSLTIAFTPIVPRPPRQRA